MTVNAPAISRLKQLIILFIALTFIATLPSCAVAPDEMEMLDSSARAYERAFRWGDFARAKSFHKNDPELQDLERRRLKLYRVTGYDLLQVDTPDKYNSYVVVDIKYYKHENAVIKSMTVKQHWKRDKGTKFWYLDSKFPELR